MLHDSGILPQELRLPPSPLESREPVDSLFWLLDLDLDDAVCDDADEGGVEDAAFEPPDNFFSLIFTTCSLFSLFSEGEFLAFD